MTEMTGTTGTPTAPRSHTEPVDRSTHLVVSLRALRITASLVIAVTLLLATLGMIDAYQRLDGDPTGRLILTVSLIVAAATTLGAIIGTRLYNARLFSNPANYEDEFDDVPSGAYEDSAA